MRKIIIVAIILLVAAVGASLLRGGGEAPARKSNGTTLTPEGKLPAPAAHSISPEEKENLIKDTRENIEVIIATTDDTKPLEKALAGDALKQMSDQISGDLAAGRVKMRRYDGLELKLENVTEGVGGVAIDFIDNSYLVDADTGETIQEASGAKISLLLAVIKKKDRWVIIEILTKELKEDKQS